MSSHSQERPVICIGCGIANRADADFCEQCSAPLTSHAATDPYKSIFARGYLVGKAVSQPRRPLVVLGIWLMFGPALVPALWGAGLMCSLVAHDGFTSLGNVFQATFGLLFFLGLGLLFGEILYKTTSKYMEQTRSLDSEDVSMVSNRPRDVANKASNSHAEESTCLQCGQQIPPDETTCTKCGWSFEDSE